MAISGKLEVAKIPALHSTEVNAVNKT